MHEAFVTVASYTLPPFVKDKASGGEVRWRVMAIDTAGRTIGESEWRRLVDDPTQRR